MWSDCISAKSRSERSYDRLCRDGEPPNSRISTKEQLLKTVNNFEYRKKGISVRLAKETIKRKAARDPAVPPRDIIVSGRQGLTDEALMKMPRHSGTYNAIARKRLDPDRIKIVKSNVDTLPTSVMTDFEQAAINAFKEVFGSNWTIRTCLFHLSQSIHRHIKRNGLSHIYSSNEDYRTLVRSLAALSFLPVRQVEPAFQLLLTEFWKLDLLSIAESVFSYFKRNYIHVQGARNSPLFPPTVWNQKETQDAIVINQPKLGGPGSYIEIDESSICKRKYSRGRYRRGSSQWVFGGVERGVVWHLLLGSRIERKKNSSRLIKNHIRSGTTIISDEWPAYRRLGNEIGRYVGYKHLTICHKNQFVRTIIEEGIPFKVHTISAKGQWAHMKHKVKRLYGTSDLLVASYVQEAVSVRIVVQEKWDFLTKFVAQISGIWSRPFDHCSPSSKAWKGVEKVWLVPHELTQQNKGNRVTTFTALLERHEQRPISASSDHWR
uniref:ISXO2-like transposase domain-containing protein n=1 Tax=Ditylenchus dipsaci TaxID=166011 RepID=A0A915EBB9_9BILA